MRIDFAAELDPEQYRAVTTTEGPVLIVAGAGSGQTRVIIYRIAKLLSMGVPQEAILALTFTNKAAKEMAERARTLVRKPLRDLTISTFHSFGASILRKDIGHLGWKENFSIYDESDRARAVKECAREMGFSMDTFDSWKISSLFSALRAGHGELAGDDMQYRHLYDEYRKSLNVYNAVDFDDLIAMPLELFAAHPDVAARWKSRYRYVLIDEFQDTSRQQYDLMMAICGNDVCAVGDDDQSIYSWRGADFGNLLRFERDFPGLAEIRLERNYRSTGSILEAANAVISHNAKRKKKALWSPSGSVGTPLVISEHPDDSAEAEAVVAEMKKLRFSEHLPWDAFGILVRTNAQARVIEEALMETAVPYRTAGGPSFYQRKEVRDMLAYMRVAANPDDDMAVLRVLNVPRRGIGKAGMERLVGLARSRNVSVHIAGEMLERAPDGRIAEKLAAEVSSFFALTVRFRERVQSRAAPLSAALRDLVRDAGYWRYLLEEHRDDDKAAAWKYRNIELLAASIERWEKDPDTLDAGLFAYLARVALVTRDDPDDEEGKVSLLTIHAAKGLEFDTVFLPGCEEGIMPHAKSVEEGGGDIEEERRLFYVAITRARKRLFLSRCAARRVRGGTQATPSLPSSFLAEIPAGLLRGPESDTQGKSESEIAKDFFGKMRTMFGGAGPEKEA